VIFFVKDIDSCYRLKIFLERFFIKAAVMNSELPQNSRSHILLQFNKGIFDYLIATDEKFFAGDLGMEEPFFVVYHIY
jgi:ATP-dependent RNA helicase DDX56/DBP9